ncbi:BNR-repeat neuraminidase N-terminal domain-containing protein, partial [Phocaeicola coprophilus]|uniref:BNR-repeat neuraminidase N-terminal domain-containing protein n=1 Tax=Phocaeicola coprophilus TaxID=387090 RepID=UPI0026E3E8E6
MMKKNGIFLVWGFWQLVCMSAAGQVDVTFHRASLPVLSGEDNNHVGYLQAIRPAGSKDRMTGLSYSFEGTDCLDQVEEVSLYACDNRGKMDRDKLLAVSKVSGMQGHF